MGSISLAAKFFQAVVVCLSLVAAASAQSSPPSLAELRTDAVRAAADRIRAAIVQLQPIGGADPLGGDGSSKPTTGLFIADGLIVTSSYGLDPAPSAILVTDDSGARTTGKLLAIDENRHVALIETTKTDRRLKPLVVADSVRIGSTAIAVGRTFRADEPNLSVGVISAVDRLYGRALQTDAAISPANYGGLLINLRGEVLGVIAPLGESSGGGVGWYDSGIGFAVPLPAIQQRIDRLRNGETIRRGLAGLAFKPGAAFSTEPVLMTVHPGGPAAMAGLRVGDVVQSANGRPVRSANDYRLAADALDAGQELTIEARRGEKEVTAIITLAAKLESYRHAYLGIALADKTGNRVAHVVEGSPAALAGIVSEDQVIAINGEPTSGREAIIAVLGGLAPQENAEIKLSRGEQVVSVSVKVGELTYAGQAAAPELKAWKQEKLVVPGSPRSSTLKFPTEPSGRRPTLVWLGGDWPSGVSADELAKLGCVVIEIEESRLPTTPEADRSYLNDLLALLTARKDFDEQRLAIGGSGRASASALAAALAESSRFDGVIVNRWPTGDTRIRGNSPSLRIGALLTSDGGRDERLSELLKKNGYPVQNATDSQATANWLYGLDRL